MMDILGVYERPYNPKKPVVCLDEKSKQLLEDARKTLGTKPGQVRKCDYEYIRHGTVNLFAAVEPKGRTRTVLVRRKRKKRDFAGVIRYLLAHPYKKADKLVLATDNLNTHNEESLIETFGEETGRQLCNRIEWHYTPKHAGWLDQAEIEIGVLSRQCLRKPVATIKRMRYEVACWVKERNNQRKGINWTFTREKAQEKFQLNKTGILRE